ncbi:hypothetical protein BK660_22855 [Pseudomonas brassicacearum]|uniref:Uncharacterized protein n=1 Tax=Pseudomonas brassicacearum TaxID=930166 RepID=A0A423HY93_9PSED|nr:hypothetical protein [Pseudomonas brassicacearum]RON18126.1 hypothetical protein BK660_22855 [Pseudomonas brassicacearum]
MFTEYTLALIKKNPPQGSVNANVVNDQHFEADTFNFNHDYLATDGKLYLTLNTLQTSVYPDGKKIYRGIEIVFDADITWGIHKIADRKVCAAFWKMWKENGTFRVETFRADKGVFHLMTFDHDTEQYKGYFNFTSLGDDKTTKSIEDGEFIIEGRSDIAI